jgi:hypothetical protein
MQAIGPAHQSQNRRNCTIGRKRLPEFLASSQRDSLLQPRLRFCARYAPYGLHAIGPQDHAIIQTHANNGRHGQHQKGENHQWRERSPVNLENFGGLSPKEALT